MDELLKMVECSEDQLRFLNHLKESYEYIDRKGTSSWLKELPSQLYIAKKKWQLDNLQIFPKGRLGLLVKAFSHLYNSEVIIKIIPQFLKVFEIEYNAYSNLSNEYMCPLLAYKDEYNMVLLKKLESKSLDFKSNKQEINELFQKVYSNSPEYRGNDKSIFYINILRKNLRTLRNNFLLSDERRKRCQESIGIYNKHYKKDDLYLIHGDLHKGNLLFDNSKLLAIDPLGYVAPISFMFARFIILELFYSNDCENYLNELLDFTSDYFDRDELATSLLIDSNLLMTALLIQFKNINQGLIKMDLITNLLMNYYNQNSLKGEKEKNEKNCYRLAKA